MRIRSGKRILMVGLLVILAALGVSSVLKEGPLHADITEGQLVVDNVERAFRIVVPHQRIQPTPVVFAFHGIGDSTESMAKYSQLDRIATRNSFLLVYPQALKSTWATMNVDLSNLDSNPDVRFFDELLEHLSSAHQVDRKRVYVIGMSNGATFAQLLATARSDDIAAVVAHSGSRLTGLVECDPSIPMMLIVGANDSACSAMSADADQYRRNGNEIEYICVPRLEHEWAVENNEEMWQFLSRYARKTEHLNGP